MVINHQRKFLFVHIPKSGGTSVRAMLEEQMPSCQRIPDHGTHATASDLCGAMGVETFNEYYTFAVVRNPLKRLISFYTFALARCIERIEKRKRGEPVKAGISAEADIADAELMTCLGPKQWLLNHSYIPHVLGRDIKTVSQTTWCFDENGNQIVNDVFKLEEVETLTTTLSRRLGEKLEMPWVNTSPKKATDKDALLTDPDIVAFVRQHYSQDLEMFGYEV